jgi:hypothetical protein
MNAIEVVGASLGRALVVEALCSGGYGGNLIVDAREC